MNRIQSTLIQFLRGLLAASLLALSANALADAPPSEASIRDLLAATEARNLIQDMSGQIDKMMEQSMGEALKGKSVGAEEEKVLKKARERMAAVVKDLISWESMEPFYIKVYQDSFSQDEVNAMLAFYRSDAGKAVTRKLPQVMRSAIAEMQKRIPQMMVRMKEAQDEMVLELKAAKAK
jgi:uncharacterized protein